MKTKHLIIAAFLALATLGTIIPLGCATRSGSGTSGTNHVATIDPIVLGKDIRVVTRSAARLAISKDPEARKYVTIAYGILQVAIRDNQYNPEQLRQSLLAISVDELHDPAVVGGIIDAVEILQNHFGELVNQKLSDGTPYLVPVLTGFRDGLGDALGN